jgi:hypothetical protein
MTKRQIFLGVSLVVAAWFAFVADTTPSEQLLAPVATSISQGEPVAVATADNADKSPKGTSTATILRLRPRPSFVAKEGAAHLNFALFVSTSWDPPQPKIASGPPPSPELPPLPYAYLGKKLEGGRWEVYLGLGDDARVARPNSLLDENYRVDSIAPPIMSLTYLPLKKTQTLNIGTTE